MELGNPFLHNRRNITADNFFTSDNLVVKLWNRNTTYVGALRNDSRSTPQQALSTVNCNRGDVKIFYSENMCLVSFWVRGIDLSCYSVVTITDVLNQILEASRILSCFIIAQKVELTCLTKRFEALGCLCRELRPGKAVGVDGIPAEALKAGGPTIIPALKSITDSVRRTGKRKQK